MNRPLLALVLCSLSAACGAGRAYTLGATGPAAELYGPIEACASQRSLQSNRSDMGVQVHIDEVSFLSYQPGPDGQLAMNVVIDDSKIPPAEQERKFAAVKSTGDEIFGCAQNKGSVPAPAPSAAPVPAPAPIAGAHGGGSIDWKGNWMAKVEYKWSCKTSMTRPESGKDEGTWMLSFSGAQDSLTAHVKASHDGYDLTGTAASGALKLCGPFPLRGKSTEATTMGTNLCFIADAIDGPAHATGHVEGSYVTGVGLDCKVVESKLDLSR